MEVITHERMPETEVDRRFLQGMADRMAMSFFKYGAVSAGFPHRVNAIDTLKMKLEQYEKCGNAELLMDVANYAMIEFMRPRHPDAHYRATDSRDGQSKGRAWVGEVDPSHRANSPDRWK